MGRETSAMKRKCKEWAILRLVCISHVWRRGIVVARCVSKGTLAPHPGPLPNTVLPDSHAARGEREKSFRPQWSHHWHSARAAANSLSPQPMPVAIVTHCGERAGVRGQSDCRSRFPHRDVRNPGYAPSISRKRASLITFTPSLAALSSFDPASSPARR
jgi:hypothetical protein